MVCGASSWRERGCAYCVGALCQCVIASENPARLSGEQAKCVCLRVRHLEELAAGGIRGFRPAAGEPVGPGG